MTDPVSVFTSAIAAFNGVRDIGKAIIEARDDVKRAELATQFYKRLIEAQALASSAFGQIDTLRDDKAALAQQNRELEDRIRKMEERRDELAQYVLHRLPTGAMVRRLYSLDDEPIDPPVYICANCATRGDVTFLQPESDGYFLACSAGHERILAQRSEGRASRAITDDYDPFDR